MFGVHFLAELELIIRIWPKQTYIKELAIPAGQPAAGGTNVIKVWTNVHKETEARQEPGIQGFALIPFIDMKHLFHCAVKKSLQWRKIIAVKKVLQSIPYQPVHAIFDHSLCTGLHGSQWIPLPPPGRDAGVKMLCCWQRTNTTKSLLLTPGSNLAWCFCAALQVPRSGSCGDMATLSMDSPPSGFYWVIFENYWVKIQRVKLLSKFQNYWVNFVKLLSKIENYWVNLKITE